MSTLTAPITRWYSWEAYMPLIYLSFLTMAEVLITLSWPFMGMAVHVGILLALSLHSVISRQNVYWILLLIPGLVSLMHLLPMFTAMPHMSWITWPVLAGLWGVLLIVGTKTVVSRYFRLDMVALEDDDIVYMAETPVLIDNPPVDADTAEQLAFMLWAWFSPISVLVVAHDQVQDQAVVELAVGATGCRLRGFEGIRQPWTTFAVTLADSRQHGDFLETTVHPFSHHTRNYLILTHEKMQRWFIVCVDELV